MPCGELILLLWHLKRDVAVGDVRKGRTSPLRGEGAKGLPVTQIVAANQLAAMRTLPSALYLPHPEEFLAGSFRLPWDAAGPGIVGQFARDRGALVPDRLVTSAKSWLSNPHIDPKQRTLPWRSDIAEKKLSPFECSSRYLQHLKESFRHSMHQQYREWDLADSQVGER
jgi:hypothetical protein